MYFFSFFRRGIQGGGQEGFEGSEEKRRRRPPARRETLLEEERPYANTYQALSQSGVSVRSLCFSGLRRANATMEQEGTARRKK